MMPAWGELVIPRHTGTGLQGPDMCRRKRCGEQFALMLGHRPDSAVSDVRSRIELFQHRP